MEQPIQNLSTESIESIRTADQKKSPVLLIALIVLVVGLGIGSGYLFSRRGKTAVAPDGTGIIPESKIVKGSEFGLKDASTFKDTAEGILEAGGIDGEGTHKLVRAGGVSQTVYLMSSALDLDQFVGKKIQIWGETNRAQKAGWLMDVGRVKILE